MKYQITIKQISPATEQRNYDKETKVYEQTIDVADESVFIQGIIAEINKLPKPI